MKICDRETLQSEIISISSVFFFKWVARAILVQTARLTPGPVPELLPVSVSLYIYVLLGLIS